jgi:hypothetical protein
MEVLRFEKKQLMLQWRSSLIGLTRRDEALASAHEALREAEISAKDYDTEIEGIKREILRAQARSVHALTQWGPCEVQRGREIEKTLGTVAGTRRWCR